MIWLCLGTLTLIFFTFPLLVMWHVNSNDPRRNP